MEQIERREIGSVQRGAEKCVRSKDVRSWMPAARPCHRRHLGRRRVAQGYFSATILVFVAFDGLTGCGRGTAAERRAIFQPGSEARVSVRWSGAMGTRVVAEGPAALSRLS